MAQGTRQHSVLYLTNLFSSLTLFRHAMSNRAALVRVIKLTTLSAARLLQHLSKILVIASSLMQPLLPPAQHNIHVNRKPGIEALTLFSRFLHLGVSVTAPPTATMLLFTTISVEFLVIFQPVFSLIFVFRTPASLYREPLRHTKRLLRQFQLYLDRPFHQIMRADLQLLPPFKRPRQLLVSTTLYLP